MHRCQSNGPYGILQTASGLGIVTMAAATHPHELKKVQAQLDEVVGRDRRKYHSCCALPRTNFFDVMPWLVPNFDDEPFLTRVIAFVLEVHRWRLIAPFGMLSIIHRMTSLTETLMMLGFAHKATKDIVWVRQTLTVWTSFDTHEIVERLCDLLWFYSLW